MFCFTLFVSLGLGEVLKSAEIWFCHFTGASPFPSVVGHLPVCCKNTSKETAHLTLTRTKPVGKTTYQGADYLKGSSAKSIVLMFNVLNDNNGMWRAHFGLKCT